MDSLGISTVLEGCRHLTKITFTQLDIAETVFERMASRTTQLQVCVVLYYSIMAFEYHGHYDLDNTAASMYCITVWYYATTVLWCHGGRCRRVG